MFDVRDFEFVLAYEEEHDQTWFIIRYTDQDEKNPIIYLDTVESWRNDVREGVDRGRTIEQQIDAFRISFWEPFSLSFSEGIKKRGKTFDQTSFDDAVSLYFATLKAIAEGVVCHIDFSTLPHFA